MAAIVVGIAVAGRAHIGGWTSIIVGAALCACGASTTALRIVARWVPADWNTAPAPARAPGRTTVSVDRAMLEAGGWCIGTAGVAGGAVGTGVDGAGAAGIMVAAVAWAWAVGGLLGVKTRLRDLSRTEKSA